MGCEEKLGDAPQSAGCPVCPWATVTRENEFHLSRAIVSRRSTVSFTIVGRTPSVMLLASARITKLPNTIQRYRNSFVTLGRPDVWSSLADVANNRAPPAIKAAIQSTAEGPLTKLRSARAPRQPRAAPSRSAP